MGEPTPATSLLDLIASNQKVGRFQELLWEGTYTEYLEMVKAKPGIARNAYQRLYDLVETYGTEEYTEYKKTIIRHKFFDDPFGGGADAVFGIDVHLMKLVRVLRAAALGYGPEHRVILLHGPVGSSKSTIARLFKKGLEHYSRTNDGALYTFSWMDEEGEHKCPMFEDPLRLLPTDVRQPLLDELNQLNDSPYRIEIEGDLCPVRSRMIAA